jgi:hypothetical protein
LDRGQAFDVDVLPYLMFPRVDLVHPGASPRYLILFFKDRMPPQALPGFRQVASVDNHISLWERTHGH